MKTLNRDFVYLGSQSASRRQLLDLADIPYKILSHTSDEQELDTTLPFYDRVIAIAQGKMQSLVLPNSEQGELPIFVLTADTLIRTMNSNQVFGKPNDVAHARAMIATLSKEPAEVVTGCCLEKKIFKDAVWQTVETIAWATASQAEFIIDDVMIDRYFEKTPNFLNIAAACLI